MHCMKLHMASFGSGSKPIWGRCCTSLGSVMQTLMSCDSPWKDFHNDWDSHVHGRASFKIVVNSFPLEESAGETKLPKSETVMVVGASPRRGHLLVEYKGQTHHVPYQFLELKSSSPPTSPSGAVPGINIWTVHLLVPSSAAESELWIRMSLFCQVSFAEQLPGCGVPTLPKEQPWAPEDCIETLLCGAALPTLFRLCSNV